MASHCKNSCFFFISKQNSRSAFVVGKGQLEEQRFYDPFFFLTCCCWDPVESAKRWNNECLLYTSHFILPNGKRWLLNHVMENWTDGTGIIVFGMVLYKPFHFPNLICSLIQQSLLPQLVLKFI